MSTPPVTGAIAVTADGSENACAVGARTFASILTGAGQPTSNNAKAKRNRRTAWPD